MSRTNKEVRDEILRRVNELDKKNVKRKKMFYSCIPAAACLIIVVAAAVHYWNQNNVGILSHQSTIIDNNSDTTPSNTMQQGTDANTESNTTQPTTEPPAISVRLFQASKQNPDHDSFGEDELAHIDIVLNGEIVYRQLPLEEYAKYGFKETLEQSDFGEFLGNVVEIYDNDLSVKVGAQEPNLEESAVYYYAPAYKSAIIVKKNQCCSIFVLNNFTAETSHSLKEIYSLYGAFSSDDISHLTYSIYGMAGTQYCEIENGTVTDRNKINSFYEVTTALVPFEIKDPQAPTPDWLIEAQEEYKKNSEKIKREDITINIHFKNGKILEGITYQPYMSTGYVESMELLTSDQNNELRAAITAD